MFIVILILRAVYSVEVLKHIAPWEKFWSEGIETFYLLGIETKFINTNSAQNNGHLIGSLSNNVRNKLSSKLKAVSVRVDWLLIYV